MIFSNKLSLKPGHKARFLSLFEVVDKIYPKEKRLKKTNKSSSKNKRGGNFKSNYSL